MISDIHLRRLSMEFRFFVTKFRSMKFLDILDMIDTASDNRIAERRKQSGCGKGCIQSACSAKMALF